MIVTLALKSMSFYSSSFIFDGFISSPWRESQCQKVHELIHVFMTGSSHTQFIQTSSIELKQPWLNF